MDRFRINKSILKRSKSIFYEIYKENLLHILSDAFSEIIYDSNLKDINNIKTISSLKNQGKWIEAIYIYNFIKIKKCILFYIIKLLSLNSSIIIHLIYDYNTSIKTIKCNNKLCILKLPILYFSIDENSVYHKIFIYNKLSNISDISPMYLNKYYITYYINKLYLLILL